MNKTWVTCCSLDPETYGAFMWALNLEPEPIILPSTHIQSYYDRLYNISHDINYKGELCPD